MKVAVTEDERKTSVHIALSLYIIRGENKQAAATASIFLSHECVCAALPINLELSLSLSLALVIN